MAYIVKKICYYFVKFSLKTYFKFYQMENIDKFTMFFFQTI